MWWLPNPLRKLRAALAAAAAAWCALPLAAQVRGQAEATLQGYYLEGNGRRVNDTTGAAFTFKTLVPGVGLLSGSLEAYGSQNHFQTGDNYLDLRGLPWLGRRWTFGVGDFRVPAAMVDMPQFNVFYPEITARGARIEMEHGPQSVSFFWGLETVNAGPRVPFRVSVPQTAMGLTVRRKLAENALVAVRYLDLSTGTAALAENPTLFPSGRAYTSVRSLTAQSSWRPAGSLKLYAEAGGAQVAECVADGRAVPLSLLAGLSYETRPLTIRASYTSQSTTHLPLAGYYAGDRRGPYGEVRVRPLNRLELYGSASRARNNLENNPQVTSLRSINTSGGFNLALPGRVNALASISTVDLRSREPGAGSSRTLRNQQVSASLARPLGRHSLRLNWRDLRLATGGPSNRQRSSEIEDIVRVRRVFFGAAARLQQSAGEQRRNSAFLRGSAQGTLGRLSVFSNVEFGNDLANQTVFTTNAYSTSVVGASMRLATNWNVSAEYFRNRMNVNLNRQSIFLLENQGVGVSDLLTWNGQSSVYVRFTRRMLWGGGLPTANLDRVTAAVAPLVGTIEGVVQINALNGPSPAAGVPVTLDKVRSTTTGDTGRYRFEDVYEGEHYVRLSTDELPAEFDPGPVKEARVVVQARRTARADLNVLPLTMIRGSVRGPARTPLDGIVIRLMPSPRYTTTDSDGNFTLYNVPEGDYEIAADPASLPPDAFFTGGASLPAVVRVGQPVPSLEFSFTLRTGQKPVRKVLDLK